MQVYRARFIDHRVVGHILILRNTLRSVLVVAETIADARTQVLAQYQTNANDMHLTNVTRHYLEYLKEHSMYRKEIVEEIRICRKPLTPWGTP